MSWNCCARLISNARRVSWSLRLYSYLNRRKCLFIASNISNTNQRKDKIIKDLKIADSFLKKLLVYSKVKILGRTSKMKVKKLIYVFQ